MIIEMFGFTNSEDIINKNIFTFIDSSSHEKAINRISEMLKENYTGASEYQLLKKTEAFFIVM